MLYKRPNFKMGGSPTGIETLEPRKKFQFGTPGFQFLEAGDGQHGQEHGNIMMQR